MKKSNRNFLLVIPARYNSSRLKGKLLMKVGKYTVIEHVINRCIKAVDKKKILVATDNYKIVNLCKKININYLITSKKCLTGTDRVAEVAKKIKKNFYINVQGDEIFVSPKSILASIKAMSNKKNQIVNCYTNIKKQIEFNNHNVPKVVLDKNKNLLFISRSPIPGSKKKKFTRAFKQVCIYGFRRNPLLKYYFKNSKKSLIEKIEDIEIIRFLENGVKVKMIKVQGSKLAIDTHQNILQARKILK